MGILGEKNQEHYNKAGIKIDVYSSTHKDVYGNVVHSSTSSASDTDGTFSAPKKFIYDPLNKMVNLIYNAYSKQMIPKSKDIIKSNTSRTLDMLEYLKMPEPDNISELFEANNKNEKIKENFFKAVNFYKKEPLKQIDTEIGADLIDKNELPGNAIVPSNFTNKLYDTNFTQRCTAFSVAESIGEWTFKTEIYLANDNSKKEGFSIQIHRIACKVVKIKNTTNNNLVKYVETDNDFNNSSLLDMRPLKQDMCPWEQDMRPLEQDMCPLKQFSDIFYDSSLCYYEET